ncbi:MAG: hypothetical protein KCHDKBKB_00890 [Elusimicrobia bacterium]|nr:hypothetical protein [Elusimicrobiota bacterium]
MPPYLLRSVKSLLKTSILLSLHFLLLAGPRSLTPHGLHPGGKIKEYPMIYSPS